MPTKEPLSVRDELGRLMRFRLVTLSVVMLIVSFVAWSLHAKMDIIAVAAGRVVPVGKSTIVQVGTSGVVSNLLVGSNSRVHAGDLLLQLDDRHLEQAESQIQAQILELTLALARVDAHLSGGLDHYLMLISTVSASDELLDHSHRLFVIQQEAIEEALVSLDAAIAQIDSEMLVLKEEIAQQEARLQFQNDRLSAEEELNRRGVMAALPVQGQRAEVAETEGQLAVLQARLNVLDRKRDALVQRKRESKSAWRLEKIERAEELRKTRSELRSDLSELQVKQVLHQVRAPIDGITQDLEVNSVGAALSFGDTIMKIVPSTQRLKVLALIQNKDVGFIQERQVAKLKFESFPFTKYGTIDGSVAEISFDIVETRNSAPPVNTSTDVNQRAVQADVRKIVQGSVYEASILLAREYFMVDGRRERIRPGMTATVDIKIGERRVIDFLITPISRYFQTGLRER